MSNRYHQKWHRTNHHTLTGSTVQDAGYDPIASPEFPFQGEFCIDGVAGSIITPFVVNDLDPYNTTPNFINNLAVSANGNIVESGAIKSNAIYSNLVSANYLYIDNYNSSIDAHIDSDVNFHCHKLKNIRYINYNVDGSYANTCDEENPLYVGSKMVLLCCVTAYCMYVKNLTADNFDSYFDNFHTDINMNCHGIINLRKINETYICSAPLSIFGTTTFETKAEARELSAYGDVNINSGDFTFHDGIFKINNADGTDNVKVDGNQTTFTNAGVFLDDSVIYNKANAANFQINSVWDYIRAPLLETDMLAGIAYSTPLNIYNSKVINSTIFATPTALVNVLSANSLTDPITVKSDVTVDASSWLTLDKGGTSYDFNVTNELEAEKTFTANRLGGESVFWGRTTVYNHLKVETVGDYKGAGAPSLHINATGPDASLCRVGLYIQGGRGLADTCWAVGRWNADIADCQYSLDPLIYGKCYYETGDGLKICNKKCQKAVVGIASDLYGFLLGDSVDGLPANMIPISIGGWVLAYVDKEYETGTPLTSDQNGNLTEISLEEKRDYPERILAIYKKKEPNEVWGEKEIKVLGRHWVKVK